MADDPVVAERGVLTAPAEAWDLAVRRADVIRELAAQRMVGLEAADAAASQLGVSRRQIYVLVGRWRAGEGVASDLLPGTSSGGRGGGRLPDEVEAVVREVLRTRYLTRQRRTVASVYREITRECKVRGLRVPSRGTVLRRIARLDPVKTVTAREGSDAARTRRSAGGTPPEVTGLLEQVQADHTPVDAIVVDEKHRLPVGRPYLTVAIDVCSRCVLGMVVTLEELAQRMADRGFGFSQATVWKIESGQCPVRASELIALADSLGIFLATDLTRAPDTTRHTIRLERASGKASDAYRALKEAAAAYLETQVNVVFAAREAHDAGLVVTELYTSWLTTPPEEAVIEARVEAGIEDARSEQVNDVVVKILDALRSNGYEPNLRIEDITYHEGGPLPAWTPEGTADGGPGSHFPGW